MGQLKISFENIPPLSPAAEKILHLCNKLDTSPAELVKEIRLDPVIQAKILGLVNSSWFSLSRKISSLEQAVVLLGFNTIKNLTLTTIFSGNVRKASGHRYDHSKLWKSMISTAVLSKILAKKCGLKKSLQDSAFTHGLLHDLGLIILANHYEQVYSNILEYSDMNQLDPDDVMEKTIGINCTDLSAEAAQYWNLPESFQQMIRCKPENDEDQQLLNLVLLASVHGKEFLPGKHGIHQLDGDALLANSGLKQLVFQAALIEMQQEINEVASLLGLEIAA